MARRLNTHVHVGGRVYGPDDDVPGEVAERITAPGVWDDEPKPEVEPAPKRPAAKPKASG